MDVLIIDDDTEFARDLACVWPAEHEAHISCVTSSGEALAALRSHRPQAVVLDLTMPPSLSTLASREGLALLGALMGGYLGELPVIVATDSDDEALMEWCRKLGAKSVLRKSEGLSQVCWAVADAIRKRKPSSGRQRSD